MGERHGLYGAHSPRRRLDFRRHRIGVLRGSHRALGRKTP